MDHPEEPAKRASRRMAAWGGLAAILRDAVLRTAPQDEVRCFFASLVSVVFLLPTIGAARADDLWRHGTLVPKGDAGFIYMAAEGGFAKAQGLDLKMQAFQNDPLMMKALIAGELDSYEGSPISPLIAGSKGADVRIPAAPGPVHLLLAVLP